MGGEWSTAPFGQLVENFDSIRVPVKEADRKPGRYPYYGASGVVDHVDSYLFDGEYLLVAEDGENLKTRQTPIAFVATGKFWVNNHAHIVRANANNDTRFLMYAMRVADIGSYLTGSTMPKLTQANMNRVPVVVPPLAAQREIARILSALDDKIELNRKMNATLEAMARALFKSWFVDFDPVRAKAEGRTPSGMDADTAKLFPSGFVESEMGPIPKGWRPTPVRDAFNIADGKPIAPADRMGQGPHPVYGANGIIGSAPRPNVDERCVVLGKIGTCGSLHWSHSSCWVTNNAFVVRSRVGAAQLENVWWALKDIDFKQYIGGSANPYMPLKNFGHHLVLVPPTGMVDAFEARAAIQRSRIIHNEHEARSLAKLRDALLPRLLSGELSVAGAERAVEEVA